LYLRDETGGEASNPAKVLSRVPTTKPMSVQEGDVRIAERQGGTQTDGKVTIRAAKYW